MAVEDEVKEPVTVAQEKVLIWHDASRMINAWQICKLDANNNPIDETNREVVEADIVKYLGFRPDGGEKQYERIPAQVRVSIPGRSAGNPNHPFLIIDTHVQVNMSATSISAMAELSGDFPYGIVKVEGFIVNEPVVVSVE
jgi:hypothetical protein